MFTIIIIIIIVIISVYACIVRYIYLYTYTCNINQYDTFIHSGGQKRSRIFQCNSLTLVYDYAPLPLFKLHMISILNNYVTTICCAHLCVCASFPLCVMVICFDLSHCKILCMNCQLFISTRIDINNSNLFIIKLIHDLQFTCSSISNVICRYITHACILYTP